MSKKILDAFAFRGFDSSRILQRPFFKAWREKYHVDTDNTDEKILAFATVYFSDIQLTETKNEMLADLLIQLEKAYRLVQRHANAMDGRLENYRRRVMQSNSDDIVAVKRKIERAENLSQKYILRISRAIGDLKSTVKKFWLASEQDLQSEYRRRFGERLKQAREKAGLSRKDLGDATRITANGFGLYETGKRDVSIVTLIRLARTLKVTSDWLIGLE